MLDSLKEELVEGDTVEQENTVLKYNLKLMEGAAVANQKFVEELHAEVQRLRQENAELRAEVERMKGLVDTVLEMKVEDDLP